MKPLQTNEQAIEFIKTSEGFRADAYLCPAGRISIGYGTTDGVAPGMSITMEEAQERLLRDVAKIENAIAPMIIPDLGQNAFSACVSLAYNIGIGAFQRSTLLEKINGDDMHGAAEEFLKWRFIHGVASDGLLRRRQAERDMFLIPDEG